MFVHNHREQIALWHVRPEDFASKNKSRVKFIKQGLKENTKKSQLSKYLFVVSLFKMKVNFICFLGSL
jgi:hypothetical protein